MLGGSDPRLENGLGQWTYAQSRQNRARTGSAWNQLGCTINYTRTRLWKEWLLSPAPGKWSRSWRWLAADLFHIPRLLALAPGIVLVGEGSPVANGRRVPIPEHVKITGIGL